MGYNTEQYHYCIQPELNGSEREVAERHFQLESELSFGINALTAFTYKLAHNQLEKPIMELEGDQVVILESNNLEYLKESFTRTRNSSNSVVDFSINFQDQLLNLQIGFYNSNYNQVDARKHPQWTSDYATFNALYYTFRPELESSMVRLYYGINNWRNSRKQYPLEAITFKEMRETFQSEFPESIYHPSTFHGCIVVQDPKYPDLKIDQYVEKREKAIKRFKKSHLGL